MSMLPLYSLFLFFGLSALLILLFWFLSEKLRRRRLRMFGDARVLGLSERWCPRFIAALLFALGFACVAAILAAPVQNIHSRLVPLMQILLDTQSFEALTGEPGSYHDDVSDALRPVIQQAPSFRFSAYRPAQPIEAIAPPTWDSEGLLILLAGSSLQATKAAPVSFSEMLRKALADDIIDKNFKRHIVAVTLQSSGELSQLQLPLQVEVPEILFVRPAGLNAATQYGLRNSEGQWTWNLRPEQIRDFFEQTGSHTRPWYNAVTPIQILAFAGFLLLSVESLWVALEDPNARTKSP